MSKRVKPTPKFYDNPTVNEVTTVDFLGPLLCNPKIALISLSFLFVSSLSCRKTLTTTFIIGLQIGLKEYIWAPKIWVFPHKGFKAQQSEELHFLSFIFHPFLILIIVTPKLTKYTSKLSLTLRCSCTCGHDMFVLLYEHPLIYSSYLGLFIIDPRFERQGALVPWIVLLLHHLNIVLAVMNAGVLFRLVHFAAAVSMVRPPFFLARIAIARSRYASLKAS